MSYSAKYNGFIPPAITESPFNDDVRDCVEQLEPEDLWVVLAFFYERKTYAEIAQNLGLGGRTSGHYRVQRALSNLKALLAEKGIREEMFG